MPPGWFARGRISRAFYAAFRPLFCLDLERPADIPSEQPLNLPKNSKPETLSDESVRLLEVSRPTLVAEPLVRNAIPKPH
jgi:hypothetical protein